MMSRFTASVMMIMGLTLAVGCASTNVQPTPNPIEIHADEYSRVFNAALLILREQGYQLDQQDHRFGQITTQPQSSPSMVEIWDRGNTTAYQAIESTISHERRVIRIMIEPLNAPAYQLRVQVDIERLTLTTSQLSGSTQAGGIINRLTANPAEYAARGIPRAAWRPVARDPYLEQRLIRQIINRSIQMQPTKTDQNS